MNKNYLIIACICGVIAGIFMVLLWVSLSHAQVIQPAFVPDTPEKEERLLMAIYKAEGGHETKYPFGIRSVTCDGYADCRQVCLRTVRNNIKRWHDSGRKVDYLTFLRNRYCPLDAQNDPTGLNSHWLKNVKWFLNHG